jgi:adenosylmethionine-8-amino-7-oxononanoate aminotransferase
MEFALGHDPADVIQREHGVIVRQLGPVLAMSPPLVIGDDQIRRLAGAVIDVVSRLRADGTFA